MPDQDPWAEAASQFKAQPGTPAAPATSGANEDWKLWQQNSSTPESHPIRDFVDNAVNAVNPIAAIRDWSNRFGEVRKVNDALGAFQEQDKTGKPMTADQESRVDTGMNANLPGAEGNALAEVAAPGVKGADQIRHGDVAGGFGTLAGGYAVPAAIGAGVKAIPSGLLTGAAKGALKGAMKSHGLVGSTLAGIRDELHPATPAPAPLAPIPPLRFPAKPEPAPLAPIPNVQFHGWPEPAPLAPIPPVQFSAKAPEPEIPSVPGLKFNPLTRAQNKTANETAVRQIAGPAQTQGLRDRTANIPPVLYQPKTETPPTPVTIASKGAKPYKARYTK